MPHKFNAARRHKFPKKRYRVTNWAEYTEILRRRGDLTIWVTDDTLKQWRAPRRTTPGGQPKYSNIAIETCLTLRTIYKTTAAPDPRADAQHRSADGSRHSGAGFLNTVAPRARLEIACKASGRQNRADPSDHGQYWIEDLWRGRVAAGQA